jgi:hypothetical protein
MGLLYLLPVSMESLLITAIKKSA